MNKKAKLNSNPFERAQPVATDFLNIPLLGVVRASKSSDASGDYDLVDLISNFRNADQEYVTLEVLDDAMINAGILKGDYLTIKLYSEPNDGDIVVVKLGEKFCVRKYYRQNNLVRLETVDAYPSTLVIESKTPDFLIVGKVQSVLRQF
jgi:SOS-response transcriptional repressor LexA